MNTSTNQAQELTDEEYTLLKHNQELDKSAASWEAAKALQIKMFGRVVSRGGACVVGVNYA